MSKEGLQRRSTDNQETVRRLYFWMRVISILALASIIFLIGLVVFWKLDPRVPIKTLPKPYPVVYPANKVVHQGEYLSYEFNYIKYSPLQPTLQRQFVDGLVFNVSSNSEPTVLAKGTYRTPTKGKARVEVYVPETLPPGKYQLRIIATYQLNPLKQFRNENVTELFEVVPGKHPHVVEP